MCEGQCWRSEVWFTEGTTHHKRGWWVVGLMDRQVEMMKIRLGAGEGGYRELGKEVVQGSSAGTMLT